MATLKKTAEGKVDKRTKEYKDLVERAKKARQAKAKAAGKPVAKTASKTTAKKTATSTIKRRADGKVDKRTKEGKEIADKMAKARAARTKKPTGIAGLLKKLLK